MMAHAQADLFANHAPASDPPVAKNSGGQPAYIKDHRKRLYQRFIQGGPDAMPDYEILELVLFRAIARHDVKPLAHRLLSVFGDFNAVISAPNDRLAEVKGVGDAVIRELKVVEAAAHRLAKSKISERAVISSWDSLIEYCHTTMAHKHKEQFRVLFLDKRNRLLADECLGQGTVDSVAVYPREVIKRALSLSASALILIHNHPSGDPTPSDDDINITRQIETVSNPLGIVLHDHLIIGKSSEISFRAQGLI